MGGGRGGGRATLHHIYIGSSSFPMSAGPQGARRFRGPADTRVVRRAIPELKPGSLRVQACASGASEAASSKGHR